MTKQQNGKVLVFNERNLKVMLHSDKLLYVSLEDLRGIANLSLKALSLLPDNATIQVRFGERIVEFINEASVYGLLHTSDLDFNESMECIKIIANAREELKKQTEVETLQTTPEQKAFKAELDEVVKEFIRSGKAQPGVNVLEVDGNELIKAAKKRLENEVEVEKESIFNEDEREEIKTIVRETLQELISEDILKETFMNAMMTMVKGMK